MRRRTALTVAAVLFALLAFLAAPAGAKGSAKRTDVRAKHLAFATKRIRGNANFGEPSLAIDSKDHIFVCGPHNGGSGLIRSVDWKTFDVTTVTDPAGGEDCHIERGPDDSLYLADLQIAAGAIRKSTDDGKTWGAAYEDPVEQDRQWVGADPTDPNIVYYAYHDFAAEAEVIAKSTDGGATFLTHTVATLDPGMASDTYPNTFSGPIVVDPTDHNRVFVVYGISSLASNEGACTDDTPTDCPFGMPHSLIVAVSTDGGTTWTNHYAIQGPESAILGLLFPKIAVDQGGNIYVAGAGRYPGPDGTPVNGLYYAYSTDHGTTWSGAIKVATGLGATVFPAVVGGRAGVADFAWIESSKPTDSDTSGVWRLRFAQSRNATSPHPKFIEAHGPVVRHGAVCVLGINCQGNRDLLDFMDIKLDSFGYAHMVVASTEGGLHTLYWRQQAGPSGYTVPCKGSGPSCVYVRPGPRP